MNDQTYMLILRILHIVFGVFWAGSAIFFALYLMPSLKAAGPDGMKFMQALGRSGYPIGAMVSAIITIVAGFLLLWKISGGFQSMWFKSWYARTLTIGATLALIAFIIGFTVNRPSAARINYIGGKIAAQGGTPTNEQVAEMTMLRKKIFVATKYIALLLTLAIVSMSVFRYIN